MTDGGLRDVSVERDRTCLAEGERIFEAEKAWVQEESYPPSGAMPILEKVQTGGLTALLCSIPDELIAFPMALWVKLADLGVD